MMNFFFEGLKVVELSSVLAGPAVGQFFAELGADVLKIENKTTNGDVTRKWKLPNEAQDNPFSAYYAAVNYGKRSIMLDLSQKSDRDILLKEVKNADILISNFKESSAKKMALDYQRVQAINPKIIYAQLYAFGPGTNRPAFDVVLQAEAGFLYMTGHPGEPPAKMPVALIDLLAAHQLKEGILLALLQREKTGKGCFVSTSLLESAISSLANQATNWLMAQHIPQPMGTAHPNIAPYGDVFWCEDQKPLLIAAGTERQFKQLCKAIEMEMLITDERFSSNSDRVNNRSILNKILEPFFKSKSRDEISELLDAFKVPYGKILNMKELFETEAAQLMVLEENITPNFTLKSVKTVAFSIKNHEK